MQTPSDFSITFPRVLRSVDWEDKIEPGNVACVEIIDAREIIRNYFAEMYLGVEYEHQILASWNTARPNQITRENVDNANRIHARLGAPQLQGLLGRDIPQLHSIPLDADLLTTDAYDSFAAKVLADLDDWPRVDAANATKLAYQKRRSFFPIRGIYLTQVAPRCSVWGYGGLSADAHGIRDALLDRRGVPPIRLSASLAQRVHLPSVRRARGLAHRERLGGLHGLRLSRIRDSGDGFREHSQAVDAVVPGDLVADISEDGGQRFGVAEGSWYRQLQDRMDVAAQVAPRNGAART